MADLVVFPLRSRTRLVRSIVDDLETVHGEAANVFWRSRIATIVAELRDTGMPDASIRESILDLQDAVQAELRFRAQPEAGTGAA